MRILYITRKFLPSIGGMQTQSHEFYNALQKKVQVHLVAWGHAQKYLPIFIVIALCKSVYYLVRYDIDVIQLGDLVLSPIGLVLKCLFNKKTLAMAHGKDVAFNNVVYKNVVLSSAKKLDGIVCVSEFLRQRLEARGANKEKLFVNPNGINTAEYDDVFDRGRSKQQLEIKFGIRLFERKILLAVTRLVRKKGIAEFIKNIFPAIVKNHPDTVFLMAGGPGSGEASKEKKNIIALVAEQGLQDNICFLGDVTDRKMLLKQIYSAADLYVMPNRHIETDFEGFGIVALEAAINTLPVVAFGVDGIPDAVKNGGNGVLVPEDDDAEFVRVVKEFLDDTDKRLSFGAKARKFVQENYNWDKITEEYLEILGKITVG